MLTVTNGSLNLNDKNTDVGRNYYNIEMGKYLFNDFMVTAAFGINHGDDRFGFMYDLGSKFSVNAWTSATTVSSAVSISIRFDSVYGVMPLHPGIDGRTPYIQE